MTRKTNKEFLTYFPDHVYRYIDSTGEGRPPVSSTEKKPSLNEQGYESYFTVNGFYNSPNAQKNNCSSLNTFYVDIDGRKNLDELEDIKKKFDPTFIIETQNGYHIYWLLDEAIYRDELEPKEWNSAVKKWEQLEQNIVENLNADPKCKDLTRILRVPDTFYWKKTGEQYKKGTEGVFKIKGLYKEPANTYSMDEVAELFPTSEKALDFTDLAQKSTEKANDRAEAEKKSFFDKVNAIYPLEERESFQKLISGHPATLPTDGIRNDSLLVTASLMKQAGWSKERAVQQIDIVGWHGIEDENGGVQEIMNTINSAYNNNYTYSYKHELIEHNMSPEESQKMQEAFTGALKERREQDKVRFSLYENEILARNPYLRKNDIGLIYRYDKGVYKEMSDLEISDMILRGLEDDMLLNFRTKKNVSDKVACLLSKIPKLEITNDGGYLINLENGILNIETRELIPHTPNFVSLIQYPVEYDPEAQCPIWKECVIDWMKGPEQHEKIRLLQQFCGYILSSSMTYDRALFMVGDGGNGKSTFVDTISSVVGKDATSHIDLEGLYGQFGMKGLVGKRLNIIEEVHGNYYQSNKLKKLISGEQVTIDIKYKDQFTFRPQAKFVFAVNMMPRVDDVSTATERRICAVQFLQNYRKNPNYQLRSDSGLLAQEKSGILNWMLDGAKDLAENDGFISTQEQKDMLDEYRAENSSVEGFLSQCVELDPDKSIKAPDLYQAYKEWSISDGGRKIKANITFTKEVKAYGDKDDRFTYVPRQSGKDEAKFVGVTLNKFWDKRHDW